MNNYAKILTMMVYLLVSVSIIFSQDTDPRDTVLQAIDNLLSGHTYTSDVQVMQTFTGDDTLFSSYNSQSVEGTVDADANYQLSLSLRAAETEDMIEDMPPLKIELVSVDDVQYINFDSISEMYADTFPDLVEGWQTTEDLLATFEDDTAQQLIIQNLTNITLPSEGPLTDNLIESVTELESEEIDDMEMRVFEVELDALQVLIMQSTGTLEQMRELLESTDFILKSEYTLTYTLWIGAEDGLLYQGESEGYTYLPYLTEEQDGPPYDITIEYSSAFTISDHGTVETIILPAEME